MPSLGPKDQLTGLTKISGDPTSLEGTYKMEVLKYEDMNELEKKMQDLREIRKQIEDEYHTKLAEVQDQIDQLDYENKKATQFLNRYIKIQNPYSTVYMHVDELDRRVEGVGFRGPQFEITSTKALSGYTILFGCGAVINIKSPDQVEIIDKAEFEAEFDRCTRLGRAVLFENKPNTKC